MPAGQLHSRKQGALVQFTNTTTGTLISIPLSQFGTSTDCKLFVKASVYASGTGASGYEGQTDVIFSSIRLSAGTYTLGTITRTVENHDGSTITASSTLDISSGNLRVRYSADINGESIPGPVYAFAVVELRKAWITTP